MTIPELNRPLWLRTHGRTRASLSTDLEVDVAVVGAGITGLMTALSMVRDRFGMEWASLWVPANTFIVTAIPC